MRSKHQREYDAMLEEATVKKMEANCNGSSPLTQKETDYLQCSIESFVQFRATFA
jgi:hypothetical protein